MAFSAMSTFWQLTTAPPNVIIKILTTGSTYNTYTYYNTVQSTTYSIIVVLSGKISVTPIFGNLTYGYLAVGPGGTGSDSYGGSGGQVKIFGITTPNYVMQTVIKNTVLTLEVGAPGVNTTISNNGASITCVPGASGTGVAASSVCNTVNFTCGKGGKSFGNKIITAYGSDGVILNNYGLPDINLPNAKQYIAGGGGGVYNFSYYEKGWGYGKGGMGGGGGCYIVAPAPLTVGGAGIVTFANGAITFGQNGTGGTPFSCGTGGTNTGGGGGGGGYYVSSGSGGSGVIVFYYNTLFTAPPTKKISISFPTGGNALFYTTYGIYTILVFGGAELANKTATLNNISGSPVNFGYLIVGSGGSGGSGGSATSYFGGCGGVVKVRTLDNNTNAGVTIPTTGATITIIPNGSSTLVCSTSIVCGPGADRIGTSTTGTYNGANVLYGNGGAYAAAGSNGFDFANHSLTDINLVTGYVAGGGGGGGGTGWSPSPGNGGLGGGGGGFASPGIGTGYASFGDFIVNFGNYNTFGSSGVIPDVIPDGYGCFNTGGGGGNKYGAATPNGGTGLVLIYYVT